MYKVAIDSIIERVGSGLLTNPLRIKLWADSSQSLSLRIPASSDRGVSIEG